MATIKLDLNWRLKNLDGKEMEGDEEGAHAGKLIASLLSRATEAESPIKFFDWALKLYNKQDLQLDDSDFETLKKFVKSHKGLFAIAQAQILTYFTEAKEASEPKKDKKEDKKEEAAA